MAQPKTQITKDIAATNRIIEVLNPYIFFEKEMSDFVSQRTAAQIEEIKDSGLKAVSQGCLFFALNNTELGIESMETAVSLMNSDMVTWRTYMQCTFWRLGPISALEVAKRANEKVVSPQILRDSMYYASVSGCYLYAKQMYNTLVKLNVFDEILPESNFKEREGMKLALSYFELAENSGKAKLISELSCMMFEQLTLGQKIQATNRLLNVSENDSEFSLIYEVHIVSASPQKCASMNLELISKRVDAELCDWDVGCMFVCKNQEDELNVCNS